MQKKTYKAPKTAKRDSFSPYGFGRLEELPQFQDRDKARGFLKALSEDPGVSRVMRKHQYTVGALKEMYPDGKVGIDPVCVMGLNKNKGQEILLRLRTDDLRGFQRFFLHYQAFETGLVMTSNIDTIYIHTPTDQLSHDRYNDVKKVLYHELAHNEFSDHDNDFKALMSKLIKEGGSMDWTQGGQKVGTTTFDTMRVGTGLYEPEEAPAFQGSTGTLGAAPDANYYERLSGSSKNGKRGSGLMQSEEVVTGALSDFINAVDGETEEDAGLKIENKNLVVESEIEVTYMQDMHVEDEATEKKKKTDNLMVSEQSQVQATSVGAETGARSNMEIDEETTDAIGYPDVTNTNDAKELAKNLVEMGFGHDQVNALILELPGCSLELAVLRLCEADDTNDDSEESSAQNPAPAMANAVLAGIEPVQNENLSSLEAMGFDTTSAEKALSESDGELQRAIGILLNGSPLPKIDGNETEAESHIPANPSTVDVPSRSKSGSSVLDDRQMRLESAVKRLRESATLVGGAEAAQGAYAVLVKLLSNALEHPEEDKFKSIRLANKAFQSKVARFEGGVDVLRAVGWEEKGQELEKHLAFVRGDPALLWLGKATVEQALQELRQAQAA